MIEYLRTRKELETIVSKAFVVKYQCLEEIRQRGLYAPEYMGFYDYLDGHWGLSQSWWDQTKRSATKAAEVLEKHGVTLGNENAARKLRAMSKELEEDIIVAAQRLAGQGVPITGAHIASVIRTLQDVCITDHVDVGDGTMAAPEAAMTADYTETLLRRKQHAIDGAKAKKNGWSKPFQFKYIRSHGRVPMPQMPNNLWDDVPNGALVEIQWRIVKTAEED